MSYFLTDSQIEALKPKCVVDLLPNDILSESYSTSKIFTEQDWQTRYRKKIIGIKNTEDVVSEDSFWKNLKSLFK